MRRRPRVDDRGKCGRRRGTAFEVDVDPVRLREAEVDRRPGATEDAFSDCACRAVCAIDHYLGVERERACERQAMLDVLLEHPCRREAPHGAGHRLAHRAQPAARQPRGVAVVPAGHDLLLQQLVQPKLDTVALAKSWMHFAEEAGKETAAQRRRSALVLQLLIAFLRDALSRKLEGPAAAVSEDDERLVTALTGRFDADGLLELLERCLEADVQIGRYVQLVLVIEGLLDGLGRILRR